MDAFLTKITDPTTCTFSTSVMQPSDAGGSISSAVRLLLVRREDGFLGDIRRNNVW